jgi:hypothetical protein
MITTRIAAALAAGALSVGILAGSAGTIALRDGTAPQTADWTAHMSQMGSMVSVMAGQGGMMGGQTGIGSGMMTPSASGMPGWMQQHHGGSSQAPGR